MVNMKSKDLNDEKERSRVDVIVPEKSSSLEGWEDKLPRIEKGLLVKLKRRKRNRKEEKMERREEKERERHRIVLKHRGADLMKNSIPASRPSASAKSFCCPGPTGLRAK